MDEPDDLLRTECVAIHAGTYLPPLPIEQDVQPKNQADDTARKSVVIIPGPGSSMI